jgi:hypothetical protein
MKLRWKVIWPVLKAAILLLLGGTANQMMTPENRVQLPTEVASNQTEVTP